MKNVSGGFVSFRNSNEGIILEFLVIKVRYLLFSLDKTVKVFQFYQQYGSLQGVQSGIHAHHFMKILLFLPVIGDHSHLLSQVIIIGQNSAAIAETA